MLATIRCPVPFMNQWPTPLQDLFRARGVDVVFFTGLEVLGYPPTWATAAGDYIAVMDAVTRLR